MADMRLRLATFLVVILCGFGCASTDRGLKVIDPADAKRGTWAAPKTVFKASEKALVRVHGYGGHRVRLELWREPNQLVGAMNADIPKASMTRTNAGIGFHDSFGQIVAMEQEKVQWRTTDWHVTIGPLRPGNYEVRLLSNGQQREAAKFVVEP